MALGFDLPCLLGKQLRHLTHHEEGRFDALRCERRKDAPGITRRWSIVESKDDFVVGERQRLRILHRSYPAVFYWINRNSTANAKGVWLPVALNGHCRRADNNVGCYETPQQ